MFFKKANTIIFEADNVRSENTINNFWLDTTTLGRTMVIRAQVTNNNFRPIFPKKLHKLAAKNMKIFLNKKKNRENDHF